MISEEQEVSLTTRKTKGAKGGGTIRQRPDGRWEARYTLGIDPGTGKQIQKSVYGKTQKEVRHKAKQGFRATKNLEAIEASRFSSGARYRTRIQEKSSFSTNFIKFCDKPF